MLVNSLHTWSILNYINLQVTFKLNRYLYLPEQSDKIYVSFHNLVILHKSQSRDFPKKYRDNYQACSCIERFIWLSLNETLSSYYFILASNVPLTLWPDMILTEHNYLYLCFI